MPRRLVERSGSAFSAPAAGDLWSQWPPRPARRPVGLPALVRGAPRAERRESRSPKSFGRDRALSYDGLPWRTASGLVDRGSSATRRSCRTRSERPPRDLVLSCLVVASVRRTTFRPYNSMVGNRAISVSFHTQHRGMNNLAQVRQHTTPDALCWRRASKLTSQPNRETPIALPCSVVTPC